MTLIDVESTYIRKGTEVSKSRNKDCRVTLVANPKGGVGKTTILVNLAAMRNARGGNVLIIDTDKQGTASKWANRRNEYDFLDGSVQCIQAFNDSVLSAIRDFSHSYTDILVDSAGRDSGELRRAWTMADDVIIPMSLSIFDLEHISDLNETHERAKDFNPDARASIMLRPPTNPSKSELQRAYDQVAEKTSLPIAPIHLPMRKIHTKATDIGWSTEEFGGSEDESKRVDPGVTEMLAVYGYIYGN